MKKKRIARSACAKLRGWICWALICAASISVRADTITVTNTNDSGPGSLRQAIADATDGDTINVAVTGTIGLTTGELLVDKSITISGPGAENLAVNGNAKSTVFHIAPSETVTISGLTIINGYTTDSGGDVHNDHATLTLNNCTVTAVRVAASTMMRYIRVVPWARCCR